MKRQKPLKAKRNQILHHIHRLCKDNAEQVLERKAKEVERLHDGAQMFKAVNLHPTNVPVREHQFLSGPGLH